MEELSDENLENPEDIAIMFHNVLHNTASTSASPERSPKVHGQLEDNDSSSSETISNEPSQQSLNLQGLKSTIRERNAVMFNNEMLSDVHFLVGSGRNEKRIPAHKYVLAIGSSVFFAMFNGDLAETKDEIRVPDVDPDAFLVLLKYLYCDSVDLDPATVLVTLYASKKYIVPPLAQSCVDYLESSLSHKNACILLSQSRLFEEKDLTCKCWEVIDAQAELALGSDSFTDVDERTLAAIVSRDSLNVKETTVFEAAHKWATAQCLRLDLEATAWNKRKVLGSTLNLIRVPAMDLREFADGPAVSGLLTSEEVIQIFLWYSASTKPPVRFPINPRQGLTPCYCRRFQSSAYRSNQWRYRGRCDSIRFMATKRIFIAGFGLYGSSTGAATYSAHIKLSLNSKCLAEEEEEFFSDGSSKTFPVWFRHPVQCEAEQFYTASIVLGGSELSYFGQEGLAEVNCNGVTIQFQCSRESTNGTGVQGGQLPELIFYRGGDST